MTMHNTLHTGSTAHAVLNAQDARLGLAGVLAKGGTGPLDVRLGVLWPSAGFAVAGTSSTSPWQYSVPGATFVMSKGSLDGPHVGSNDATVLASTIAPPASNSRYDVIYVMQQDADATISADATTAPLISVYNGPASATPSRSAALAAIPAGALALADALVPSSATAGTSDPGITITQDFLWTTTRGAPIPVRNATEKAAITWGSATDVARVFEIDTGTVEQNNGSGWVIASGSAGTSGVLAGSAPPAGTPLTVKTFYGTTAATNSSGITTITYPGGAFRNGVVAASVCLANAAGTAQSAYTLQTGVTTLTAIDVRVAALVSGAFAFASGVTPSISLTVTGW